ncbi:HAD family hydrolase [Noviherbaspirillum cavernae]|uniref:D,D-heptose 1,7-bisphosphate phosphatase n=1 Tax=Noviherbaspirillum cavernae TaxID=2320862 RepID=A0A418X2N0_9BURK|nr:HAD family hydrolase [Noviherbaspirillum cavernae]RJG06716.1 HAD family hydrolase [Noviherbaspirillum cavernae]
MRAIFLDKDGTLIENVPHNVNPELIALTWLAGPALQLFQQMGYALFVVSNQPGIAHGCFTEASLETVRHRLAELLAQYGVSLNGFYYCPHSADGMVAPYATQCACRKPEPGMLRRAAQEHGIDLARSWMIGDILDDVEAGMRAGCRTALIDNGNETHWHLSALRTPHVIAPDLHAAAQRIALLDEVAAGRRREAGGS